MSEIGMWEVTDYKPRRLSHGVAYQERHLEEWIQSDPGLIRDGLIVVGRQFSLNGGAIDLLGIDPTQGNWTLIEVKSRAIDFATVTQAYSYALEFLRLSYAEVVERVDRYLKIRNTTYETVLRLNHLNGEQMEARRLTLYVVGTGSAADLRHLSEKLGSEGIPVVAVTFEFFEDAGGRQFLVRHERELAVTIAGSAALPDEPNVPMPQVERLFQLAAENGIGDHFKLVYEAATQRGLAPRLHKSSVMFTPPADPARTLICIWANSRNGRVELFVAPQVFTEFFPVNTRQVTKVLGRQRRVYLDFAETTEFVAALHALFDGVGK